MSNIDWDTYLTEALMTKHPESELFSDKVNAILSAGCIYTFSVWVLAMVTVVIVSKVL